MPDEPPTSLEPYLRTLAAIYRRGGAAQKLEIVANARVESEYADYDNWNGGVYGIAVRLAVPEPVYLNAVDERARLEDQLQTDLNGIYRVQGEYIRSVYIELLADPTDGNWRAATGAVMAAPATPAPVAPESVTAVLPAPAAAVARIWTANRYRVFLSHISARKVETAALATALRVYGIDAFVAHESVQPTLQWQGEIEAALRSMDAFVALLTDGFHESLWTDQEIGFAVARGVPIIPVRFGPDPYGFIGRVQALSCTWGDAPLEIAKLLMAERGMIDAFIGAVEDCAQWDDGNRLAALLPGIQTLTSADADRLANAYRSNSEVRGAWGFNGTNQRYHGPGLAAHLRRITDRDYDLTIPRAADDSAGNAQW